MLKIRYHHLNCLPRFTGKGYSDTFCENLLYIKKRLESGEPYETVLEADDICAACPNLINGVCKSEDKVSRYDKLTKENPNCEIKSVCSDCQWFYICKNL